MDETTASLLRLIARLETALTHTEAALGVMAQRAEDAEARLDGATSE